jgi:DNA-binding CsgD family transcriptional regulator
MPELLERSGEFSAIEAALDAAVAGFGSLILIEGEAGTGKTSLLTTAADLASDREMRRLSARGGEHEREFPYAVIRQLFESRLMGSTASGAELTGAAALAAPVFDIAPGGARADRMAIRHGLYWLAVDLASERPLALLVDDAHWADSSSLEALLYIARRLEELPVAMVLAARVGEPDSPDELLRGLRQEPGVKLLTPAALTLEAAAELGRRELGRDASERFLEVCHEATGGNPFLLVELLRAIASDGIEPRDANADRVTNLASAGVAGSILARLARLGEEAAEVARCVAVLEPNAETEHVAALAGLALETAAEQCEWLIRARLLADARPVAFLHPLIREAVYSEMAAPRRAILHTQAARRLSASGAPPDSVASHLLRAPPGRHDWVVVSLRTAAREARARGVPEAASEYLERARAEPPRNADLLDIRRELGAALLEAADPRGIEELLAVRAALDDPALRAELVRTVAPSLTLRGRPAEAITLIDETVGELGPGELSTHLLGQRYIALMMAGERVKRDDLLRDVEHVEGHTRGERHLLSVAGMLLAFGLGRTEETISIAGRAVADPDAIEQDALAGSLRGSALLGLAIADRTDLALALLSGQIDATRRRGSQTSRGLVTAYRAQARFLRGELAEARADAELALRLMGESGMVKNWPMAAAVVIWVLRESGDHDRAAEMLSRGVAGEEPPPGLPGAMLLCARGALWSTSGRPQEARDDFLNVGERVGWIPYPDPEFLGWRQGLALAEFALGRVAEAQDIAKEALDVARSAGGARGIGVSLRLQGVIAGAGGINLLGEAVEMLATTTGRLQHAHALVDLGAALRRANRRREAREPLREGMELAHRCGAVPLEERAQTELAATGARPRKVLLSGVESLTPSELRVAKLAAKGMTNREIAQTLFVTAKTVEYHLGHCFQKLEIASRGRLAGVLDESEAAE